MSDPANKLRERLFSTLVTHLDGEGLRSNVHEHEEEFATALDALPCPYPPEPLVRLYERSSALRPCVEAMSTNVHGFGHRLVHRVDLNAPDVKERIAEILLAEKLWNGDDDPADPTEAEVEARRAEIERGTKIEAIRLKTFFANCSDAGYTALRMALSTDYEVTGNAYMEVVRDAAGRIARLNHCPAVNMRLRPLDKDPVRVSRRVWASDVSLEIEEDEERLRGFVQQVNAVRVYFKAFGDPRVISASSGKVYASRELLPQGERAATEIVHFAVHSGRSAYGVPRWIGAVFEVLGVEAMSQVNYLGFDNKGVPPLAVLVSGGTLTDDSAGYLEQYIRTNIKGRKNYHSLLLLEAVPTQGAQNGTNGPQTRIVIQPLAQPQDAIFLQYAARCEDVIARQWRISPITRGKTESFNRATSEAAMKKDEEQVFNPARQAFDEVLERTVLRDLGVRYHRVESNSPIASDPQAMAEILDILCKHSLLDVNEARKVAAKVLSEDLRERQENWAKQPPAFTIAGLPVQDVELDEQGQKRLSEVGTTLQRVLALRDTVRGAAQLTAGAAEQKARAHEAGVVDEYDEEIDGQTVHVMRIAEDVMAKMVRPHAANDRAAETEDEAA